MVIMAEIAKNYRDSQNIDLNAITIDCNEKIEDGEGIVSECILHFNKKDVFVKGNKFRSGRRVIIHFPESAGVTISPISGPFGRMVKESSVKNALAFDVDMID
jgi:isocitrate dehydrogenase